MLIAALSLMAFILVLLVSMTVLIRVETQTSSNTRSNLQAKEAARLALMMALGDLQKHVGPDQRVTARDLAKLANFIINTYPEYYPIYAEERFTWNKITQRNRNPLLEMNIGADGLKTGYTEESGYGLIGSAVRDGQRLIVVVNGTSSSKARGEEARKLLDWGFRAFERSILFAKDEVVVEAKVFGGSRRSVGLVGDGPIELLLPRGSRDQIRARVVYDSPVEAPVEAGQRIGVLRVTIGQDLTKETPLYAGQNVGIGTTRQRAVDGLEELLIGWW